jgi:UDP-3-O-[3-hydroxymyristoyl] glucosamine N-acyltransferase
LIRYTYFIYLSVPFLKHILFRLFGYSHSTQFGIHPDTWIRDLPCLAFKPGVYLANKSSIAANMVMMNGFLLVDEISLGEGTCIGMGSMVAPGTSIGDNTIVDTSAHIGVRCRIGNNVNIRPTAGIQHAVTIGDGAEIGTNALLALRCRIGDGVKIPDFTCVPAGVRLRTQGEANAFFEQQAINAHGIKSALVQQLIRNQSEKVGFGVGHAGSRAK